MRVIALCFALWLLAPHAAQAAESYDNCTGFITTLPAVITTQGTWCLKQDLATAITSGQAITISTNNVTIDCNNFKLGGLAAGASTATIGIYLLDRVNATVRHCNIRGFYTGVFFDDSGLGGGHAVEDNRFDGNTGYGIYVKGDGSVVQRNRVFDTGGSTQISSIRAIASTYSVDVLDNTVSGVTASTGSGGAAYGIQTQLNTGGRVSGNAVRGLVPDGIGGASGIFNVSSGRVVMRNNDIVGNAGLGSIGLRCANNDGNTLGNVISDFETGISSCYDGGNLVRP